MLRSAETYLLEIQRAATYLINRTRGMDFDAYNEDETLKFAVERNFIIIGEAMACIRRDHTHVSAMFDASGIVGLRNFMVHEYWSVDHNEVWSTLTTDVSPLREMIDEMLARPDTLHP